MAVLFLAHGLQKWDMGVDGVTNMVSGMGIPLPTLTGQGGYELVLARRRTRKAVPQQV
jgi:uncharacterized membrane protein YphA (DoxX/SURF4 family)